MKETQDKIVEVNNKLKSLQTKIFEYQKVNGFETVFDFILEDIDDIIEDLTPKE